MNSDQDFHLLQRVSHGYLSVVLLLGTTCGLAAQDRGNSRSAPSGASRVISSVPPKTMPGKPATPSSRAGSPSNRGSQGPIRPATPRIINPRPLPRCQVPPSVQVWRQRDIFAEIQYMARQGSVPVTPVKDEVEELHGYSQLPAGWRAYGFQVPPNEKLHVRLHHPNEGWFRLMMVNKWGRLEEGMLQNLIPTGNPEVTFKNPKNEFRSVYVIVDDPGWMSAEQNPYTLSLDKTWKPGAGSAESMPVGVGIWAEKTEDPKSVSPAPPSVPPGDPAKS